MKLSHAIALLALAGCTPPAPPAQTVAPPDDPMLAQVRVMERPAASSDAERAGTHCLAGEAVAFNCAASGQVTSVCVGPEQVSYRTGPAGAPTLDIASTGADGAAHADTIIGAGGGQMCRLRAKPWRHTAPGGDWAWARVAARAVAERVPFTGPVTVVT